jgi:L-threonylcarbamoyladenylate synthase
MDERRETEFLRADEAGIARAAALLRAGRLVSFGTETVYGLGADATNEAAVAGIFAAKQRPRFNPLICHYPTADAAFAHVTPNDAARRLAALLWPGPLTLVLPRRPDCPVALLTGAGLDTLAVRVPAHDVALALLRAVGRPVAAPSVLDLSGAVPRLLRPGGATREVIEALIGPVTHGATPGAVVRSPGMLASHYAPACPVRLDAHDVWANEALLAFGPPLAGAGATFNLSESSNVTEAATRLFLGLRWLDSEAAQRDLTRIAVMPVPDTGLGLAINDRLRRAAAPRP